MIAVCAQLWWLEKCWKVQTKLIGRKTKPENHSRAAAKKWFTTVEENDGWNLLGIADSAKTDKRGKTTFSAYTITMTRRNHPENYSRTEQLVLFHSLDSNLLPAKKVQITNVLLHRNDIKLHFRPCCWHHTVAFPMNFYQPGKTTSQRCVTGRWNLGEVLNEFLAKNRHWERFHM